MKIGNKIREKREYSYSCWRHRSYRIIAVIIAICSLSLWNFAWYEVMDNVTTVMSMYPLRIIFENQEILGVTSSEVIAALILPFILWGIGMLPVTVIYKSFDIGNK